MATMRQRVRLSGKGPRGVAVVGDRAYVAEHFSDTLAVLDLKSAATDSVAQIALDPSRN